MRSATGLSRPSRRRRSCRRCPRGGLELLGLDTKDLSLRAFGNIDDGLPASTGVNEFRQTLYGVAAMPKLGTDRIKLRVLYQYVQDEKDPLYVTGAPVLSPPYGSAGAVGTPQAQPAFYGSTPKKGHLLSFSADFLLEQTSNLMLRGEAVRSEFTPDRTVHPLQTDWAYAVLLTASPFGFSFAGGMRLIGDQFGAPANPALIAGRKIYDGSISRAFGSLSLSANYAHTADSGAAGSGTTGFSTPTDRPTPAPSPRRTASRRAGPRCPSPPRRTARSPPDRRTERRT